MNPSLLDITATAKALPSTDGVRFHMSLNVSNLDQSVEFYRRVFGIEPAKRRVDYAKFEVPFPPLVLSLEPHAPGRGGSLNHVGLRLPDAAALERLRQAMTERGLRTDLTENVECCYARQDKFWLHSPDGVLWEFYLLTEDLEHHGQGQSAEAIGLPEGRTEATQPPRRVAAHRIDQGTHVIFDVADGTLDEIDLQGTFNLPVDLDAVVREARRALAPGGIVRAHVLTADRVVPDSAVALPGPASVVRRVPVDRDLVEGMKRAGLVDIRFDQLAEHPCFAIGDAACRQTRLSARAPEGNTGGRGVRNPESPGAADQREAAVEATVTLMPLGPFAEWLDDRGIRFVRGERIEVAAVDAERLTREFPGSFVRLERPNAPVCGTTPAPARPR